MQSDKVQPKHKLIHAQRGGTVLGFILGLLVGLLISLVVVIYVTKVPIPFLNKSVSRTAEQDAAEEKKNKDWDPNAPLYNKSTNKSDSNSTGANASTNPSSPAATPPSKEDDKQAPVADKPASSSVDLIGDLIKSRTESAPNPAPVQPVGQDPFSYYVQAGAFRSNEEAESLRAKLVMQGYDPRISDKEQGGKTVFRVRIGPLAAKEEAEKIQLKLAAVKVEAAIVRVQR